MMKKKGTQIASILGIIAIVAVMGFGFAACGGDDGPGGGREPYDPDAVDGTTNIGKAGPGGGIIFYYNASGFTVTGTGSFTAHYLEAAPSNQGKLTWEPYISGVITIVNVSGTKMEIGTGKENTRLILAVNANAPAAKAASAYKGGGKNDWFLPSFKELQEMKNAKSHLGISSGEFWSSTQCAIGQEGFDLSEAADAEKLAWNVDFGYTFGFGSKYSDRYVRAIRAF